MEKTNKDLKNPVTSDAVTGVSIAQTATNKHMGTLKSKLQSTVVRPQTVKNPSTEQK